MQHTGVVGKRGTQTLTRGLSLHEATRTHPLLLTTRAKAGQTHNTVAAEARTHFRNGVCKVLDTVMILPQVHLRKPCYDFYFL